MLGSLGQTITSSISWCGLNAPLLPVITGAEQLSRCDRQRKDEAFRVTVTKTAIIRMRQEAQPVLFNKLLEW